VTGLIVAQAGVGAVAPELQPQLEILDMAVEAADLLGRHITIDAVVVELRNGRHRPELVEALSLLAAGAVNISLEECPVRELTAGLTLGQDVVTSTGLLIAGKRSTLTASLLERILNFHESIGVAEPVLVESRS
jgi:hypothetical protein